MTDKEFLAHFGVLGMRWGVRRDRSRTSPRSLAKTRAENDAPDSVKLARATRAMDPKTMKPYKTTDSLGDDDLRKMIGRMEMERRYKELSDTEKSKGKKMISKLFESGVGKIVVPTISAGALYWLKKEIDKRYT